MPIKIVPDPVSSDGNKLPTAPIVKTEVSPPVVGGEVKKVPPTDAFVYGQGATVTTIDNKTLAGAVKTPATLKGLLETKREEVVTYVSNLANLKALEGDAHKLTAQQILGILTAIAKTDGRQSDSSRKALIVCMMYYTKKAGLMQRMDENQPLYDAIRDIKHNDELIFHHYEEYSSRILAHYGEEPNAVRWMQRTEKGIGLGANLVAPGLGWWKGGIQTGKALIMAGSSSAAGGLSEYFFADDNDERQRTVDQENAAATFPENHTLGFWSSAKRLVTDGAIAGAATGALVGAPAFGVGAIAGGIVGGIVGGLGGALTAWGTSSVQKHYHSEHKTADENIDNLAPKIIAATDAALRKDEDYSNLIKELEKKEKPKAEEKKEGPKEKDKVEPEAGKKAEDEHDGGTPTPKPTAGNGAMNG